ncbi:MAG: hypothetical protein MZV70_50995 [Desulfobacterales bacterium]|nr:hypothetical protein [Desulfobacterales bacterium]
MVASSAMRLSASMVRSRARRSPTSGCNSELEAVEEGVDQTFAAQQGTDAGHPAPPAQMGDQHRNQGR